MSDSNSKALRKQLRNVVQDILPDIMKSEVISSIEKKLTEQLNARLSALEKQVRAGLANMDERSKDIQTFLVRASMASNTVPNAPAPEEAPVTELIREPVLKAE